MAKLLSAGATDIGLRRSNNEDAYCVMPEIGLFGVADGMGGAAAGEVASKYFIEAARRVFGGEDSSGVPGISADGESRNAATVVSPAASCERLVEKVFIQANSLIAGHVVEHPHDEGMGCTADLLVIHEDDYVIGHVGDSRVYLLREGNLSQLTKDHSLVQLQVDNGELTAEEARHHPRKNILFQVLGGSMGSAGRSSMNPPDTAVSFDLLRGKALDRDIFLLCSDGLTDMLEDADIREILVSHKSIQHKVLKLIEKALAAGGRDNVTVVLCEVAA
ncbi:MAG TPA: protein phosphatase 2C domain-containing protein [Nitrosospira sp.]|nr:protein phosphatase 2C domain-containing protein [Nitrosospira sp.]